MRGVAAVLFLLVGGVTCSATDRIIGSWTVATSKDLITDKPFPKAQVYSAAGDLLRLFCFTQKATPYPAVNVGSNRLNFEKDETPALVWRIDERPATAVQVFAFDPHEFSIRLSRTTYGAFLHASRFRMRVTRRNGVVVDMDFVLTHTEEALRDIAANCPLESAPDNAPHLYNASQDLFEQIKPPVAPATPRAAVTP